MGCFFYFLSFFSWFIDVKFSNKFHSHRTGKDVIKYLHIEEIKKRTNEQSVVDNEFVDHSFYTVLISLCFSIFFKINYSENCDQMCALNTGFISNGVFLVINVWNIVLKTLYRRTFSHLIVRNVNETSES